MQFAPAGIRSFLSAVPVWAKKKIFIKEIIREKLGCGNLCRQVAQLIADQKIIGFFQGRMEFGPRALGGRSIIGDARSAAMQSKMNLKIKFRESFRPFAHFIYTLF